MPFDTLSAISNREQYKKTMKKDLAKVKAAPAKFYFFNQFSFDGKVGPLLLVGKVKPELLAEVQSQAKLAGKGTCTRSEDDSLTFKVRTGKVTEDRLKKAVKSAGSSGEVKIVEDSTKDEKDPFAGEKETKAKSKSLEKTKKFSPERGKIDARNRVIYAKVNEILKDSDKQAQEEIKKAKDALEKALVKADKTKEYGEISKLQDQLVDVAKQAYPKSKERKSLAKAKQKLEVLTKLVEERFKTALAEAGVKDRDRLTKLKKKIDDEISQAKTSDQVKAVTLRVGDLVELVNEVNPRNAIRKEDLKRMTEAQEEIDKAEKEQQELEVEVSKLESLQKLKTMRGTLAKGLFGKKPGSQAYKQAQAKVEEIDEKIKKHEELAQSQQKVELAKQKQIEAIDQRLKRTQEPTEKVEKIKEESISGDVKEFARKAGEATQWQMNQVKDKEKHGTGRHGAQTGLERQARRLATGEQTGTDDVGRPIITGGTTPDQSSNPGGTAQRTLKWKTTIKYQSKDGMQLESEGKGKDGKEKFVVTNPGKVLQEIKTELESREYGTETASNFLNPALEKEAVDTALQIAAQCVWNEVSWNNDGNFEELDSLAITVGRPASAKGYGHAFERGPNFVKSSLGKANDAIKRFEDGKLTPDDFLKELNVVIAKDRTGTGAKIMPHATVVLTRSGGSGSWKNKSQYPTDKPIGWSIFRKDVRKFNEASVRAKQYA